MTSGIAFANRIRASLRGRRGLTERRMFGGIAFMMRGHMFAGTLGEALMVRVGPAEYERALARKHVRVMDFTGKPLRGFVAVDPAGIRTARELGSWLKRGMAFAATLPPKKGRK